MNTDWCYSGYGWRVYSDNIVIGYVVASSLAGATLIAKHKYGDCVRVEKITAR